MLTICAEARDMCWWCLQSVQKHVMCAGDAYSLCRSTWCVLVMLTICAEVRDVCWWCLQSVQKHVICAGDAYSLCRSMWCVLVMLAICAEALDTSLCRCSCTWFVLNDTVVHESSMCRCGYWGSVQFDERSPKLIVTWLMLWKCRWRWEKGSNDCNCVNVVYTCKREPLGLQWLQRLHHHISLA